MPIFDYRCEDCGSIVEILTNDKPPYSLGYLRYCDACAEFTYWRKQLSAPNFKINGFSEANGYSKKGNANAE